MNYEQEIIQVAGVEQCEIRTLNQFVKTDPLAKCSHFVTAERYTGNNRYKFVALLLLKNDRSRSIPSNDFRTPKNLRFPAEHPLDAQLKGSPLRVWINPATFKPASRESLAVVALAVVRCFGVEPLNNHLFIIDI